MLDKNEIIKRLQKDFPTLQKEFGVKRLALFGSYANNSFSEESDVDLVVEFSEVIGFKFFDLVLHLENLLGKEVDLLTREGFQNIRQKEISASIEKDMVYVEAA